MGKWLDGQSCIVCGTTTVKKHARGMCKHCYDKQWKDMNVEKVHESARNSYLKFHESRKVRALNYYYKNKTQVLKRLRDKYREESFDGNMIRALERDKYTCQICGATDLRLDVHHLDNKGIESDTPNHLLDNLQTLCISCHAVISNEAKKTMI